ncbi:MAG: hypothetical protein RLY56_1347 [Pseudomonadota bacterium]
MWQNLIVTAAVVVASLYVVWSLAPASFRRWIATRWGGRFTWLARSAKQSGCADCAARSEARSSR